MEKHGNAGTLTVSTQVLQDFFVTVTRKLKPATDVEVAQQLVQDFNRYPVAQVTPYLIQVAIERYRRESFSFWDSLVVEAAIFGDCGVLLSEDMQSNRKIHKLIIQNPFSK